MGRITWEAGRMGSQTGYIHGEARGYKAKIEVFSIELTLKGGGGLGAQLAHRLPFRGVERKFPTVKDAQAHAERYLVYAMELMGFVPKSELAEQALEMER